MSKYTVAERQTVKSIITSLSIKRIPTRIIWIIGLTLFFLGIGLLTYVFA